MDHLLGRPARAAGWRALAVAVLSVAALAAACATAASASAETTWLCRPGLASNPCLNSETATVELANGSSYIEKAKPAKKPPIDCFYVYPTVSSQFAENANENIEPEEIAIAESQASRFSQVCDVYAPIYPQLTIPAINTPGGVTPEGSEKAYIGVLTAFEEYLGRYNHGRGFELIGHSQGSAMLEQLIKEQIDTNPALRKQLVSAVLMGGNVLVPEGELVGGTFKTVPVCQAADQTHCVIAYSSFLKEPPEGAFFGRENSPLLGGEPNVGKEVVCVNPTLLAQNGSAGPLVPYASTTPFPGALGDFQQVPTGSTPWVASVGEYTAQCHKENGASWLQINPVGTAYDPTEYVAEELGPDWGLHLYDINIALGNLVKTVAIQSATYAFEQ